MDWLFILEIGLFVFWLITVIVLINVMIPGNGAY